MNTENPELLLHSQTNRGCLESLDIGGFIVVKRLAIGEDGESFQISTTTISVPKLLNARMNQPYYNYNIRVFSMHI